MTRHYCTLFDKNYMAKGLALHESLLKHSSEDFCLHILACDMDTFWLLSEMNLAKVEVIPLEPFESAMKMKSVKESRTHQEYCWTLASSFIEYLLPWFDALTYVDADIFFFSNPRAIFSEVGDRSIGIVPHRFNKKDRQRLSKNGEYNVGVIVARNTPVGLKCISHWASQCREWCFGRNEGGKFADQAYLDSWPMEYGDAVCVIANIGVNLGPWSVGNYFVQRLNEDQGHMVCVGLSPLVCYHFHEFQDENQLTNWKLRPEDRAFIYAPYVEAYQRALVRIREAEVQRNTPTEDIQHA